MDSVHLEHGEVIVVENVNGDILGVADSWENAKEIYDGKYDGDELVYNEERFTILEMNKFYYQ